MKDDWEPSFKYNGQKQNLARSFHMENRQPEMEDLAKELTITTEQVIQIGKNVTLAMEQGLKTQPNQLKMLPSYLSLPTGEETGNFLSLDFGGTNVRVKEVKLANRHWQIVNSRQTPLYSGGSYDFTTATTTGAELFDFLAAQIAQVAQPDKIYLLGHAFSFPCRQESAKRAVLINWTKEIKVTGVQGQEINQLLTEALERRGLTRIKPCVIINDTVGTLLTAAYTSAKADIGTICGTGHNACYYEASHDVIINIESGNFHDLPRTSYDAQLDAASEDPGMQQLEKMVAGRYLGEIIRIALGAATEIKLQPYCWTAEDVSGIIQGKLVVKGDSPQTAKLGQQVAQLVVARSARLVAAALLGILAKIDPYREKQHKIAVDGSLYEKMPGYAQALRATITEVLGTKASDIKMELTKDGSGVGAAIAAAISR
jgi:hexokinase